MGVGPSKYELEGPTWWLECVTSPADRTKSVELPTGPSPAAAASLLTGWNLAFIRSRSPGGGTYAIVLRLRRSPPQGFRRTFFGRVRCPPVVHRMLHTRHAGCAPDLRAVDEPVEGQSAWAPRGRCARLTGGTRGPGRRDRAGRQGLDLGARAPLRRSAASRPARCRASSSANGSSSPRRSGSQILRSSPAVEVRPAPTVWSPLEYGAHVRDVLRDHRPAARADARPTTTRSSPTGTRTRPRATERYGEQDPEQVAEDLEAAAQRLVSQIAEIEPRRVGAAGAPGRTARSSRSRRCCSTSCTTSSTTCGTSPASRTGPARCSWPDRPPGHEPPWRVDTSTPTASVRLRIRRRRRRVRERTLGARAPRFSRADPGRAATYEVMGWCRRAPLTIS